MLDVAKHASVSAATVCRILNGWSPSTAVGMRVRAAAQELGYEHTPRRRRRSSRPNSPNPSIAVLAWCNYEFYPDVGMGRVLRGAMPVLQQGGYQVTVWPAKDWDEVIADYRKRGIRGAIFWSPTPLEPTTAARLTSALAELKAVWVLTRPDSAVLPWDQVLPDDDRVGVLAAEHLLRQGHRHVAYVNCETKNLEYKDRAAGFSRTILASGGKIDAIVQGPDGGLLPRAQYRREWQNIVDRFMLMNPRPTALFAPNDYHAMFLHQSLKQRGVELGKDVTLIAANNDSHYLEAIRPQIATVDVRYEAIGRLAADWLTRRLNGTETLPRIVSLVDPVLVLPAGSES